VGARINVCSPRWIGGQPSDWGGVGSPNVSRNHCLTGAENAESASTLIGQHPGCPLAAPDPYSPYPTLIPVRQLLMPIPCLPKRAARHHYRLAGLGRSCHDPDEPSARVNR
jgi:hypothetical protein